MAYRIVDIGPERAAELRERCARMNYHTSKADINGVCVQLYTSNRDYLDMWQDNF